MRMRIVITQSLNQLKQINLILSIFAKKIFCVLEERMFILIKKTTNTDRELSLEHFLTYIYNGKGGVIFSYEENRTFSP